MCGVRGTVRTKVAEINKWWPGLKRLWPHTLKGVCSDNNDAREVKAE